MPNSALLSAPSEDLTQPPYVMRSEKKVMKKFLFLGATVWLGQITAFDEGGPRLFLKSEASYYILRPHLFFPHFANKADKHETVERSCL